MKRRDFLLGCAVLAQGRSPGAADTGITLVEPGRSAQILARPEDLPVARYFAGVFEELTGAKLDILSEQPAAGSRPLVLIGDVPDNPVIRRLAGPQRVRRLADQGILLATASEGARPMLLVAGGSRQATPGAVGELLNFHLEAGANRAQVRPLELVDNPALRYRIFWNWDHSTNWVRGVRGEQENGARNPYMKSADAYVNDFRRVLDFQGEHKLNGLIVWGFLRDGHGGIAGAKKLADHATARGVHVLPGIGTSFYGGFYYEGHNRFNVNTWLAASPPESHFLDKNGQRLPDAICPSQPANQKWLRQGAEWLFSEFPGLGGANLENGDFFTCQCQDCRRLRQSPGNDPNFYYDMMVTQLPIIEAARRLRSDAWMTYATYTGFSREEIWKLTDPSLVHSEVPRFVSQYPEDAICQWTLSGMVAKTGGWPAGVRPPTRHSIGLLHQGSQWYGAKQWWAKSPRGSNAGQRYEDISELIAYTCRRCAEEGLEGLEILGEVSDASPANELNYLAFEEFTWHPRTTMESFTANRLPRIYGSAEDARRFLRMVRSSEPSLPALLKDLRSAEEASQSRQLNARQRRRWANLRAELARRISLLA